MHFLAHLHLADNSQTSLAASLAGGFTKGNIEDSPLHFQQGIWLHQQIVQLTASHELTKGLLSLFPKSLAQCAPSIIDICFDHMLAKYWDEYHHQNLAAFALKAYDALTSCNELPAPLPAIITQMQQENWLISYQSPKGRDHALKSMAQQKSPPEMFTTAQKTVKKLDIEIETAFRTFYPQLMAYSRLWTRNTPAQYLA